ncbi:IclR family transcriptional regulator [Paenibacillus naphthalenovorans]|uniref:IclR family transcriptional regulator n=1 Tax=Paenibacillus naphthalenovorans TaxID=162209 RepID=UPI0010AF9F1C|nr:IclR family transcriptional regulator [Paenibacillus naphthalenovorans]GCL71975.1 IclR family transcriptional regulator [Paenibacillus naphthalenovorans]
MEQKYAVPALDRAHAVLTLLTEEPYKWKLSDLSKHLGISKSTLYSLLLTMERLHWIHRDRNETYALGSALGDFGSAYFRQYDLVEEFRRIAEPVMRKLQESVQLARLDGSDVLYLAKLEAPSPVQMVSGPGVRFPAHATGLGKILMSDMDAEQVRRIFPQETLHKVTVHTIGSREAFLQELETVRHNGYSLDIQEGVMGFCCVAAPVRRRSGEIIAAVSCSMPIHHWEGKREEAIREIRALGQRLSTSM